MRWREWGCQPGGEGEGSGWLPGSAQGKDKPLFSLAPRAAPPGHNQVATCKAGAWRPGQEGHGEHGERAND